MTQFIFGQRVNALEYSFLGNTLKGKSRLEQGKQFLAIKNIAKKHDTSMQNAATIYNNTLKQINNLNENSTEGVSYIINKFGCICRKTTDAKGRTHIEELSFEQPEAQKQSNNKILNSLKYCMKFIASLFKVY